MARLGRYTQSVFGATAGANQMAEFGSLANNAPLTYSGTTITPAIIQTLANYASGWFSAIIGANSPAIEDMNAICYLFAYQLSYLLQLGVGEWDSGTTYYIGSIVQDGSGNLYSSLTNANLNNALTSGSNWKPIAGSVNTVSINPATQSPYVLSSADSGKVFLVNSANGAMQFNLPAASANFTFTVKDSGGSLATNNLTIHRAAAESIELVAADYVAAAPGGEWVFDCDGTNWFIIGR